MAKIELQCTALTAANHFNVDNKSKSSALTIVKKPKMHVNYILCAYIKYQPIKKQCFEIWIDFLRADMTSKESLKQDHSLARDFSYKCPKY